MKVALCLSGHTRSYKKTEKYWKRVLDAQSMDVFISTWENSGYMGGSAFAYLHLQDKYPKNDAEFSKTDSKIDVSDVSRIFSPKAFIVNTTEDVCIKEIQQKYAGHHDRAGVKLESTAMMYYKIYDCNNLKKRYEVDNNIKYDIVIRSRFDLAMTKLNLNVPMDLAHVKARPVGVDDRMWISSSEIMDKMCDAYTILSPEYMKQFVNVDGITRQTLDSQGIPYHHCLDFTYYFVKPPLVRDYDTERVIAEYDKFSGEIV